jgi:hypothetical protein
MTVAVNRTADCTAFTVFPILAVNDFIRLGMSADTPQVLGFDLRIVVKCLHGTHQIFGAETPAFKPGRKRRSIGCCLHEAL